MDAISGTSFPGIGCRLWVFRFVRLTALTLVAALLAGKLAAQPARLVPGQAVFDLADRAEVLEHARGAVDLQEARRRAVLGHFAPPRPGGARRGMTLSAFWLRVDLVNRGARPGTWRLDVGQPYLHRLEAALSRGEAVEQLLTESDARPYHQREPPERILRGVPFTLAAGETATLWVGFAADGSASLPLSLVPAKDVAARQLAQAVSLGAFYSASGILLALSFAAWITLRQRALAHFTLFYGGLLAYNAQLDGILFAFLWPDAPKWNAFASHPIGLLTMAAGLMLARDISDAPRRCPWLNACLMGGMVIFGAYMLAPLVAPLVLVKIYAGPLVLVFLALQGAATVAALRARRRGAAFYALGVALLVVWLGFFTLTSQVSGLLPEAAQRMMLRWGQVLEGVVFMAAMATLALDLRRREAAAIADAEAERRRLTAFGHDLRQPLVALRLAVESLGHSSAGSAGADLRRRLESSTAFLGDLVASISLQARPPTRPDRARSSHGVAARPDAPQMETFPASTILDALSTMFADEAAAHGTRLRVAHSGAVIRAPSIELMRVAANLTANAIRHGGDRVLIGFRIDGAPRPTRDAAVSLEVRDNGPPMGADDPADLQRDRARRPASPGWGLGLGVVRELCARNGWRFVLNRGRRGAIARVANIRRAD